MIDVKGTKYVNSITLLPFTSVVLMVDPNPRQSTGSGDTERKIIIYPNPAHDFFNISIEDATLALQIIKIIDLR